MYRGGLVTTADEVRRRELGIHDHEIRFKELHI